MAEKKTPEKIINGTKSFLTQLMSVSYGGTAIANSTIDGYGSGQAAFDQLKVDFDNLDLSKFYQKSKLNKDIIDLTTKRDELEKKVASLTAVFGEDGGGGDGTLTHKLLETLELEIDKLIHKRNDLLESVNTLEFDTDFKIRELNYRVKEAEIESEQKIKDVVNKVSGKVRLINQFSDFLAETNKNMTIYYWIILILSLGSMLTVIFSVPSLLKSFDSYDVYVNGLFGTKTPLQIINFAFGILIVKLPWALCLSAVFTGLYRLLKGLLTTYEKINQDKRNMSAIYAVSGNIAESLNAYGFAVANHEIEDEDTGEVYTEIRVLTKDLNQKKESLKWNQIMNYFERMQNHKEEVVEKEDPTTLKLLADLLKTAIQKTPTT